MDPPRKLKTPYAVAMALIVAGGVLLRWWQLGHLSLWLDEGYSAWASSRGVSRLLHIIRADVSPPLYYMILRCWTSLFGDSEAAMRALSALAATACLPAVCLLSLRILDKPFSRLIAMALVAASVMQVAYAHEARCYALLGLGGIVALDALHRFLHRRNGWTFGLIVLAVTFTLYLHNIAFFYLVALDVAWLILPAVVSWRRRLLDLIAANALIGLLYLPWAPGLIAQLRWVQSNFWATRPTAYDFVATLSQLIGVQPDYPLGSATFLVPPHVYQVVGILLLIAFLVTLWHVDARRRRELLALAAYALLPIVLVFAYSLIARPVFISRPLIISSLIFPLLLAMPFDLIDPKRGRLRMPSAIIGCAAALLILTWSLDSSIAFLRYERKEDWRSATRYVMKIPTHPRLVVFSAAEGQLLYQYYTRHDPPADSPTGAPAVSLTGLPIGFLETDPPIPAQRIATQADVRHLAEVLAGGKDEEVDLVLTHQEWSNPDHLVEKWLAAHGWQRIAQERFWKVRVERYRR